MNNYNKANIPLAKAGLIIELDGGGHYTALQSKKRCGSHKSIRDYEIEGISNLQFGY